MFRRLITIAVVCIAVSASNCNSQSINFSGKDFYYGIPDATFIAYHNVCICSLNGSTGKIININTGDTVLFNIPPNQCDTFRLRSYGIFIGSQGDVSYRINSESEVTAYLSSANTDSLFSVFEQSSSVLIYPTLLNDKNYLITSHIGPSPILNEFVAIGTVDTTIIKIIPYPNSYYAITNPYYKTLSTGNTWGDGYILNLTGTYLSSDSSISQNPIAVFASRGGGIGGINQFDDRSPILVQQLPVNLWKRNYHAVPHLTRQGDLYRVLAGYDSTHITLNGSFIATLNTAQYFDTLLTMASLFTADKPLSIHEISRDAIEDSVQKSGAFMYPLMGDSSMFTKALFITDLYGNASGLITDNYLNLVCRSVHTSFVKLDGINVGASFQTYANDTVWSYAQLTISNGQHLVECDSGVIAYQYGYGNFRAHGNVVAGNTMLHVTGINELQNIVEEIKIYPNPASDNCFIESTGEPMETVTLINTLGEELLCQKANTTFLSLNTSGCRDGIYFIKIQLTDGNLILKKLVIKK